MSKYYALSNIKHNGELYKKGDVVDISKEKAETLIKQGILSTEKVEKDIVVEKEETEEVEGDVVVEDYSKLNQKALKEELAKRGLATEGKVAELRARLIEDDISRESEKTEELNPEIANNL